MVVLSEPLNKANPSTLSRLLIATGWIFLGSVTGGYVFASGESGITVDDLVRRAQIPLAAISPDGRFVAYTVIRGNPLEDAYDVVVQVTATHPAATPLTLSQYRLAPNEAFDESEDLQPAAAALHWTSANVLYYVTKAAGKERLVAWDSQSRESLILMDAHDRIEFDGDALWDDSSWKAPLNGLSKSYLSISSTDFIDRPVRRDQEVIDNSWRMSDGYRFYGAFRNPKLGRWIRQQNWSLGTGGMLQVLPVGASKERWDVTPNDVKALSSVHTSNSGDTAIYETYQAPSPDGARLAVVEEANLNLTRPGTSYSSARIVITRGAQRQILVPFSRPRRAMAILGWRPDSKGIYFVSLGPQESTVKLAKLDGKILEVDREAAELQIAGSFYNRKCQAVSTDGRFAVLIRSTNVNPGELIKLDLTSGAVTVLATPNEPFVKSAETHIRFYPIEVEGQDVYGRLYLPRGYRPGTRYPLVITQYISRPGYYASVGDEIPILPLTVHGIAVFSMHSRGVNINSEVGDFRLEVERVRRPLRAMKWVIEKLVADGVVDRDRVGESGLSYGAEIAMYAYWNSSLFRAVSVATGSWDPSLMLFGGLGYAASMERRGFPISQAPDSFPQWGELSAGLNARSSLPPLLIQSPDAEEVMTVPSWFQLRRVGADVEWYEYPNEGHVKRGPANKWWVFQRNLDWFDFWLNGHEDPGPAKAEQYRRWETLCDMQVAQNPKEPAFCVRTKPH